MSSSLIKQLNDLIFAKDYVGAERFVKDLSFADYNSLLDTASLYAVRANSTHGLIVTGKQNVLHQHNPLQRLDHSIV